MEESIAQRALREARNAHIARLVERTQKDDRLARDELALIALRILHHLNRRFRAESTDWEEEREGIGRQQMVEALPKYRPEKGSLYNYLWSELRDVLSCETAHYWYIGKPGRTLLRKRRQFRQEFQAKHGRLPHRHEEASYLHASVETLTALEAPQLSIQGLESNEMIDAVRNPHGNLAQSESDQFDVEASPMAGLENLELSDNINSRQLAIMLVLHAQAHLLSRCEKVIGECMSPDALHLFRLRYLPFFTSLAPLSLDNAMAQIETWKDISEPRKRREHRLDVYVLEQKILSILVSEHLFEIA